MRKVLVVLALVGALAAPRAAQAQSRTTLGVGSGAVAGALVGGPIGAVAGAVVGGLVGNSTERRRHRVRRARRYGYAIPQRPLPRRAEAAVPRVAAPVDQSAAAQANASVAAPVASAWKDPH